MSLDGIPRSRARVSYTPAYRNRPGTLRRDPFGNAIPGEASGIDQAGRPIPMGSAPREQGLHTGSLATGGLRTGSLSDAGRPSAFSLGPKSMTTPPVATVTPPAKSVVPALAATGVLSSALMPAMMQAANPLGAVTAAPATTAAMVPGAAMTGAGTTPVAQAPRTVARPSAFSATRTNMNGGNERWQPSQVSPTGGRWVGSTSPTPIVPPGTNPGRIINPGTSAFNVDGVRNVETASAGGRTIEYDPRRDTGIASVPNNTPGAAPGAVRSIAVNSKYVAPGSTGVGSVTRGGSNAPAGRLMDENGDQTSAIMGNIARADAFAKQQAQPQVVPSPAPAPKATVPTPPIAPSAFSTATNDSPSSRQSFLDRRAPGVTPGAPPSNYIPGMPDSTIPGMPQVAAAPAAAQPVPGMPGAPAFSGVAQPPSRLDSELDSLRGKIEEQAAPKRAAIAAIPPPSDDLRPKARRYARTDPFALEM